MKESTERAAAARAPAQAQPISSEKARLDSLWTDYRRNGCANCIECKRSTCLVAAVSGEPGAYQLLCASCGRATPWFARREGEIVLLGRDRFGRPPAGA